MNRLHRGRHIIHPRDDDDGDLGVTLVELGEDLAARSGRHGEVEQDHADVPRAVVDWARGRGRAIEVDCVDRHPEIRELAEAASRSYPEIRFVAAS